MQDFIDELRKISQSEPFITEVYAFFHAKRVFKADPHNIEKKMNMQNLFVGINSQLKVYLSGGYMSQADYWRILDSLKSLGIAPDIKQKTKEKEVTESLLQITERDDD